MEARGAKEGLILRGFEQFFVFSRRMTAIDGSPAVTAREPREKIRKIFLAGVTGDRR
jgi:hypothetical protein